MQKKEETKRKNQGCVCGATSERPSWHWKMNSLRSNSIFQHRPSIPTLTPLRRGQSFFSQMRFAVWGVCLLFLADLLRCLECVASFSRWCASLLGVGGFLFSLMRFAVWGVWLPFLVDTLRCLEWMFFSSFANFFRCLLWFFSLFAMGLYGVFFTFFVFMVCLFDDKWQIFLFFVGRCHLEWRGGFRYCCLRVPA